MKLLKLYVAILTVFVNIVVVFSCFYFCQIPLHCLINPALRTVDNLILPTSVFVIYFICGLQFTLDYLFLLKSGYTFPPHKRGYIKRYSSGNYYSRASWIINVCKIYLLEKGFYLGLLISYEDHNFYYLNSLFPNQ